MKYASEVLELLGAHPHRKFRMMEIVTYAIGAGRSRKERETARKAVARVLAAMEDSGSLIKAPSKYALGGYATYQLVSVGEDGASSPEDGEESPNIKAIHDARKDAEGRGLKDPYAAFQAHKHRAKERGIEFLMSFSEWWGIWKDSYHLRGSKRDSLCMGRFGDTGPYAVGNVYITTNRGNVLDYASSEKKARDASALKARRHQELMDIIKEVESLPPPQYTYEQVIAMLKLGIPFDLRPKVKVGHEVASE